MGIHAPEAQETYHDVLQAFLAASERKNKVRATRDDRRLLTRHGFGLEKLADISPRIVRRNLDGVEAPSEQAHAQAALKIFSHSASGATCSTTAPCSGLKLLREARAVLASYRMTS